MTSASDKAGPPDRKSRSGGSGTGSGPDGAPGRKRAAEARKADGATGGSPGHGPARSGGEGRTAAAGTAAAGPAEGAAPQKRAASETASGRKAAPASAAKAGSDGNGDGGNGPENGGPTPPAAGDGEGASSDGGSLFPGGRFLAYGLSGLAGGLVAVALLLFATWSGLPGGGLELTRSPGQGAGKVSAGSDELAALRHRFDSLDGRVEALSDMSGSEPLVRRMADMENTVTSLQTLVEGEGASAAPGAVARLDELRAGLDAASEELIRLDTKLAQVKGDATRTETRLAARIEALEARTPDDLPARLDSMADRKTVQTLLARVARLERDEMTRDVRSAARALALTNLIRAVETSRPFVNELKAVEVLEPGNESVTALASYAGSGLPSFATLTTRFEPVADNVVSSWRRAHGRGILANLWDDIIGLFRVRPVGEAKGMTAPALVARAEQRLEDGDLHLAVQELSKLGEPENAAAREWLEAARSRLQLERLMAELNRGVLQDIAVAEAVRRARRESFTPPATEPDNTAPEPAPPAAGEPDGPDAGAPEAVTPESQDEAGDAASER